MKKINKIFILIISVVFIFILCGADYDENIVLDDSFEYLDNYDQYYSDGEIVFDEYGNLTCTVDGQYYVWNDVQGFVRGIKLPIKPRIYKEHVLLDKSDITINCIYQEPELPTGCEIVATDTVLRYLGYPISKTKLADMYFEVGKQSGDFRYSYIGDPYTVYGLGCYAPAVTIAANKYLKVCGSDYIAFNYSGYEFETLLNEVAKGYPVIIWSTINQGEPFKGLSYEYDNDVLTWISMEHCLVLCGYDLEKGTVKVSDPLAGIVDYDMLTFKKRFLQLGSQAVIIRDKSYYMKKENIPREFRFDKNLPKK